MTPTHNIAGHLPAPAMSSPADSVTQHQQQVPSWTLLVLFPGDRCEPIPGRPSDTIASLRTRLDSLWEAHYGRMSHYDCNGVIPYRGFMICRAKSGDELFALRDEEETLYNYGLRDGSKLRLVADHETGPARSSSMSDNSNSCGGGPSITPSPKIRNSGRCRDEGGSGKRPVDYTSSTQQARILSPNTGVMPSWSPSTYDGHRPPSPDGSGHGLKHQQHQEPEMLDLRQHDNAFGGGAMDELSRPTAGSLVPRKAQQPHQRLGLSPQVTNTTRELPELELAALATGPSPDCFL
jgi:hypothetical protein